MTLGRHPSPQKRPAQIGAGRNLSARQFPSQFLAASRSHLFRAQASCLILLAGIISFHFVSSAAPNTPATTPVALAASLNSSHSDHLSSSPKSPDWWSLRPLSAPPLPILSTADAPWAQTPIDLFIAAKLREKGLHPSPPADRRTLIRRLYFDLLGLPPPFEEIQAFVNDPDPQAYEHLVDRLLASPQYGERWARHWLDVVHYGDTHGYDKDKPRPHAWPYRDYVIRAFNQDKPYSRFVMEQLAGDALFAGDADAIEATGFIAAGPWDFIGHAEVPESKIDGQIARHLDRDDMVATTMNTFVSMTVQCAQCHNHKFDPISQEDYYSLQADFAALDRADRAYDRDPAIASQRRTLTAEQRQLLADAADAEAKIKAQAGPELAALDQQIEQAKKSAANQQPPEFGYHSQIETQPGRAKWVQIDLGRTVAIDRVELVGCYDDFNQIGAGFGFPQRFKIEASDNPEFSSGVLLIADRTQSDFPNPKTAPQIFPAGGKPARYVRVTATRLAPRKEDYIFALAELSVFDTSSTNNVALKSKVSALDSIEAPPRWQMINLVDGRYYNSPGSQKEELAALEERRRQLIEIPATRSARIRWQEIKKSLAEIESATAKLPKPEVVYAGTVYSGSGPFSGTGPNGGKPRPIHILARGDVRKPGPLAGPGALAVLKQLPARFDLPDNTAESARRIALAQWIVDPRNPLTWRSIVNRIWQYHFGHALVDSPNDFGRMGQLPTHPELLDWLAANFRDGSQSLKQLHRLILTSAVYQQSSAVVPDNAAADAENRFLWRMNRRRLEAEAIRDSVLAVSGVLNLKMYGPGFQDFVVEKPEHSPHYEYDLFEPENPQSHRRSIYRFIVRSQPQPFLTTLDCADPSMLVDKRNETLTALQALALLNDKFMLSMSQYFAARLAASPGDLTAKIDLAYQLCFGRHPQPSERAGILAYANEHGLANACRVLFNLNEFIFID